MKVLDLDYWKEKNVQERIEILKKINSNPTILELIRRAIFRWLYESKIKQPTLLGTKIFMHKSLNEDKRRANVRRN